MPQVKKNIRRIKKENHWQKLQETVNTYANAMFINIDNISSSQMNQIRKKLRDINAVLIVGKNTFMRAALNNTNNDKIVDQLRGNVNIIFTNGDVADIKAVLDKEVRPSPAKAGMIAPVNVIVNAGRTGVDIRKTQIFQVLGIQTQIMKNQIQIKKDKTVIKKGDKINSSQAALLDILNIRPFEYKIKITSILKDGVIYDASILDTLAISEDGEEDAKTNGSDVVSAGGDGFDFDLFGEDDYGEEANTADPALVAAADDDGLAIGNLFGDDEDEYGEENENINGADENEAEEDNTNAPTGLMNLFGDDEYDQEEDY